MEEYRRRINGKSPKETERLTKRLAKELVNTVSLLSGRSQNGIAERLVYFDNLLAGVTFPYEYYLKSTYNTYFGKLLRKDEKKERNKWKTQHEARRERDFKANKFQVKMGRYIQDPNGKGSLKLIQTLINDYPHVLNSKLHLIGNIEKPWVSPLKEDEYAEYRDQHFIKRLKIEGQLSLKLEEFWPKRGPQWDALGKTVNNEVLLVEAKANLSELHSPASAASNEGSLRLINQSFKNTKDYFGADPNADWTDKYYQYSNRIAHLFYLRVLNKIPAYLIFVYFIGDKSVNGPSTKSEWESTIQKVHETLGIPEQHPLKEFILDIFIDIKELK